MDFPKGLILSLLAVGGLSACGGAGERTGGIALDGTSSGIIKAEKVDLGRDQLARAIPQLTIYYGVDKARTCTGTLIGDQVILTAAHCVYEAKGRILKPLTHEILSQGDDFTHAFVNANYPVVFAMADAGPQAEMPIVEAAVHPQFTGRGEDPGVFHDIALLRLARPFHSSVNMPKIKLDFQDLGRKIGTRVLDYGYGMTSVLPQGKDFVKTNDGWMRRKPFVTVKSWIQDLDLSDSFMVGNSKGQESGGVCQGDSGGPVLFATPHGPFVLGVVSRTDLSCSGTAILTSVTTYREWILQTVAGWKLRLY